MKIYNLRMSSNIISYEVWFNSTCDFKYVQYTMEYHECLNLFNISREEFHQSSMCSVSNRYFEKREKEFGDDMIPLFPDLICDVCGAFVEEVILKPYGFCCKECDKDRETRLSR